MLPPWPGRRIQQRPWLRARLRRYSRPASQPLAERRPGRSQATSRPPAPVVCGMPPGRGVVAITGLPTAALFVGGASACATPCWWPRTRLAHSARRAIWVATCCAEASKNREMAVSREPAASSIASRPEPRRRAARQALGRLVVSCGGQRMEAATQQQLRTTHSSRAVEHLQRTALVGGSRHTPKQATAQQRSRPGASKPVRCGGHVVTIAMMANASPRAGTSLNSPAASFADATPPSIPSRNRWRNRRYMRAGPSSRCRAHAGLRRPPIAVPHRHARAASGADTTLCSCRRGNGPTLRLSTAPRGRRHVNPLP